MKDGLKNKKKLEEETNKQIAEQTISINKKTIDNITAKINHLTSGNSPEAPSVFSRIFNPKKAKEAYQNYKDYWQNILDETNKQMPILEATWNNYLESVKSESMNSVEAMEDSLDKLNYSIEEKYDSEEAYLDGYLQGQTDTMILTGVGLALGCLLTAVINRLTK